jgi:malonyl CoA-acyl carrier protein transacylase
MCKPVLWQPTIENILQSGIEDFVEVGVGNTLAGLFEKIRSSNESE